ncbi:MAG: response regulator [Deltaproteobacteria bacterium]|nr:response regulator [Deltaproteobacteria bacterium]
MDTKRILAVDDEVHWRVLLATLFQIGGYEIRVGRNGREGMKLAREMKPDLIILDLMMAGEGGIPMYRQLKTDDHLRHIPVIILSGVDERSFFHALKLMNVGLKEPLPQPEAFLEKPPTPEVLMELVKKTLSGN